MSATNLLDRLDGVRPRTAGAWMARCPAHRDKSPSLSVRECDDGTVLIRCFAGCPTHDVVAAVGLELSDLFPPRQVGTHAGKSRKRPPILSGDVLRALSQDLLVIGQAVRLILKHGLTADELVALTKANDHMIDMVEAARHG